MYNKLLLLPTSLLFVPSCLMASIFSRTKPQRHKEILFLPRTTRTNTNFCTIHCYFPDLIFIPLCVFVSHGFHFFSHKATKAQRNPFLPRKTRTNTNFCTIHCYFPDLIFIHLCAFARDIFHEIYFSRTKPQRHEDKTFIG